MQEFYECKYCKKLLKTEKAFLNHYCEENRRHDILSTNRGLLAFELFSRWLYIRSSRKATHENFKLSRHFNAFVKFAKYYKAIGGLSDLDEFLLFMIKNNILPTIWLDGKIISYYLMAMECIDPKGKIERTVDTIFKICKKYECDTSEFYDNIEAHIMIGFIRMHKLSPWILLNSKGFFQWLERLDGYDQNLMDEFIDCDEWSKKFKNDEKNTKMAKKCCQLLGI